MNPTTGLTWIVAITWIHDLVLAGPVEIRMLSTFDKLRANECNLSIRIQDIFLVIHVVEHTRGAGEDPR